MCLTIPKKLVSISGSSYTVENRNLSREEARSVIEAEVGDYVVVENSIIIEKINPDKIQEFLQILNN